MSGLDRLAHQPGELRQSSAITSLGASTRRLEAWALLALVGIHVLLGIYYSVTIPIWEAHDEIGHYYFVRYIATEHRLPRPGQKLVEKNDEAGQPPLYYLLAALPVSLVNVNDGVVPKLNPYISWPQAQGGRNRVIHTPAVEAWPYRGTVLAVHLARCVSVLLGSLGLLFTFLAARALSPELIWIRWGAVLVQALWPQYRFTSSVINNDIMVTVSAALVTWLLVRVAVVQRPRALDMLAPGLATGLVLLSKNNGLALLPAAAIVLLVSLHKAAPGVRRHLLTWLAGGAAVGLLAVALWYARNLGGRAGMFGGKYSLHWLGRILAKAWLSGERFPLALLPEALWHGWLSFWAGFGWNNVGLPLQLYTVGALWVGIGLVGASLWFIKRPQRARMAGMTAVSLVAISAIAVPELLVVSKGGVQSQGRILLPALPALSVLLSVGWFQLLPCQLRAVSWAAMGGALALLAVVTPALFIRPAYALPAPLGEAQLAEYTPVHATFGDFAELVGYRVDNPFVSPGDTLRVSLAWRVLARTPADYSLAIKLLAPEAALVGEVHRFPGHGALATTSWSPGAMFAEEAAIPVESHEKEGRPAWAEVSFYRKDGEALIPVEVHDARGQPIGGSIRIGRIKVRGTAAGNQSVSTPGIQYGLAIRLVGGEAHVQPAGPAPSMDMRLTWEAAQQPAADYTVSLQLRDSSNVIVAQADTQPQQGMYPTSLWEQGETVEDSIPLPLQTTLPAGEYRLYACLYDLATKNRLPATDPDGRALPNGEALLLTVAAGTDGVVQLHPNYPSIIH